MRLSACHAWSALFAQTLISLCTGLPVDGVTVELICHSPGWNVAVAASALAAVKTEIESNAKTQE